MRFQGCFEQEDYSWVSLMMQGLFMSGEQSFTEPQDVEITSISLIADENDCNRVSSISAMMRKNDHNSACCLTN
jgi:hypothetical protein